MKNTYQFIIIILSLAVSMLVIQSCGDKCNDIVCLNGGECQDGQCICPNGFTGDSCECEVVECLNGGVFDNETCSCICIDNDCNGVNCENCPEIVNFQPAPLLRLCPQYTGVGNRDFSGNGPIQKADMTLYIIGKEIWLDINYSVEETKYDWTKAEGSWSFKLWTAPEGFKILSLEVLKEFLFSGAVDENHQLDCSFDNNVEYIKRICMMGDTGGDDVDNCTLDDAYLSLCFNPIFVKIQRI